jgi:hypothetical protein
MNAFLALTFGHFLGDFPLQGDFLATAKNHRRPRTLYAGVPWWAALFAHAFIQGGIVAAITGSELLGALELVLHIIIDYLKCEGTFGDGEFGFVLDQLLHIVCKLFLVAILAHIS